MANPHYAKIPELKAPDGIDVTSMQNALMERRKAYEFEENKALQRENMDRQASQFQQQFDLQKGRYDAEQRDRTIKMIGQMASVIDEEKDPTARASMWGRLRSYHPEFDGAFSKYGLDPADHVRGPKFLMSQAGLYDPAKERMSKADIELKGAHADYYRTMGDAAKERAGAVRRDSETKAFRAVADYFPADKTPTEAEWNVLNQPGGILHASFGGRPIPYSSAPAILTAGRNAKRVEDDALRELGMTDEQIAAMRKQEGIVQRLGKPKIGHTWEFDDKGKPFQKKLTESDDKNTIPLPQLEWNRGNIDDAFRIIAGKPAKGGGVTGGANILEKGLSAIPGGWGNVTQGVQAVDDAYTASGHAALQLSYALSGKTVGQKEQERIMQMFSPARTDTAERAAFKMTSMAQLYDRLIEAKRAGKHAPSEELYQSAMREQAKRLREFDERGRKPGLTRPTDELPKPGAGWGIRRLD